MTGGSWVPGAFGVLCIIILGVLIPLTVGSFYDIDTIDVGNSTTTLNQTIDLVQNGFEIVFPVPIVAFDINVTFNPFERPINMTSYLSQSLKTFALIPSELLVALLLIIVLGITFTIVAVIRGI